MKDWWSYETPDPPWPGRPRCAGSAATVAVTRTRVPVGRVGLPHLFGSFVAGVPGLVSLYQKERKRLLGLLGLLVGALSWAVLLLLR